MIKTKVSNKEKLRREIQSQRAKQGYCFIGNYNSGTFRFG